MPRDEEVRDDERRRLARRKGERAHGDDPRPTGAGVAVEHHLIEDGTHVVRDPVAGKPATNPSDKPKVLPVASQDINCPEVTIADNGAALRIGGPDNASVRYQFNIADTARECDPAGPSQAGLKVGVKGAVVIGPAGSAGTFSAPLKITVTRDSDKTDVFSQTYQVSATTDGVAAGPFRVVTDPIMLPMSTLQLADVYSITVGFEGGTGGPSPTRQKKKKTSG